MMKPTAAFKMKRSNKYLLARELDPHVRGAFRRALIQAQLQSEVRPREKRKDRNNMPVVEEAA
jgi:hypothetical protein